MRVNRRDEDLNSVASIPRRIVNIPLPTFFKELL